jgi:glycosyltransferase involved in cell wall biosynthesis
MRIEALLSYLGAVVVPSHALAQFLAAHGFPQRRMHVIPYGISVRRPSPSPLHFPRRIGTAAMLEQRKGIDVLLDAYAAMQVPAELDVFGDGSLRGELEARARSLAIDVRFHGFVDDLRQQLLELDAFVLPTRADNLPVAILEAMAIGLPVVATRVGGVPELVLDRETGYLVDPDDPGELSHALDAVVADPDRHRLFGEASAARIAAHFEAGAVAARMVQLYEHLLAQRSS